MLGLVVVVVVVVVVVEIKLTDGIGHILFTVCHHFIYIVYCMPPFYLEITMKAFFALKLFPTIKLFLLSELFCLRTVCNLFETGLTFGHSEVTNFQLNRIWGYFT